MRSWFISASFATLTYAYVIDPISIGQDLLLDVLETLNPSQELSVASTLEYFDSHYDEKTSRHRKLCVLHPRGDGLLDDEPFRAAFDKCGKGGVIRLPDAN